MPESQRRRCAIVTGASSGIGEAVVAELAAMGFRLALVARREEKLREIISRLPSAADHLAVRVDLRDRESVVPAVARAVDQLGRVDVLINGAGEGCYAPFLDSSPQRFAELMQLNYFAAADIIRLVLPGMIDAGRGHVINIASMSAKIGPWGHSAYSPAKAALVSLTQTLAAEYGSAGLHFSYVSPGIVRTAYFDGADDLWRLVQKYAISPQIAARRIVRLLDRPKLELCVPRHYRLIDWIAALSPELALRLVKRKSRAPEQTPTADRAAEEAVVKTE